MSQTFAHLLRAFRRDRRANIAITFALASIPITLSVGAAVDYSLANRTKAVLDGYADAAALSAISKAAVALSASKAKTNATDFFNVQAATLKRGSVSTVTANVTDSSNGRTAVVSYTATVPTTLMAIGGINNINISGSATAASAVPTYLHRFLSSAG
jgi:Flp pilus assembly protein TadG